MLKRIAIAAVAALGISVSAQAADQPVKGPVYKAAPAYNWSGWYWGGQIGGIWGDVDQDNISAGNFTSYNMSGVIGGLHIGRNWQFGNPWLFGIEADVNLTSLKGDDGGFGGLVDELKGRAEGSLRARLGIVRNNWLFYATGGLAWLNAKQTRFAAPPVTDNVTYVGWTAGVGISTIMNSGWIASLEYRFSDYGDKTFVTGDTLNDDVQASQVTFRLSRRFGTR
jgi:outer membrane immunogenic protein